VVGHIDKNRRNDKGDGGFVLLDVFAEIVWGELGHNDLAGAEVEGGENEFGEAVDVELKKKNKKNDE